MELRLISIFGLLLVGFVPYLWAQSSPSTTAGPPHDLIVAPEPSSGESESDPDDEEIDEIQREVRKYGVFSNGINICGNITSGSFLPHAGDCASFVSCEDEIAHFDSCYNTNAVEYLCDNDITNCHLFFDSTLQECSLVSDDMKCMPNCSSGELSTFCYDRTCTKYVLCYYGIPVLKECQDGLQYNSATDRCDFPEFVDCVENECDQLITPENITYIASKASCDRYYICSDGHANKQECALGLYYNPACKCCDFKSKVKCEINSQARNIKPFSRSPPRRADIICPTKGVHFYAHQRRSDAYYYCLNGNGITLDCTPGLVFDPKTNDCRYPQNVDV